jgi:hypothetical protein
MGTSHPFRTIQRFRFEVTVAIFSAVTSNEERVSLAAAGSRLHDHLHVLKNFECRMLNVE